MSLGERPRGSARPIPNEHYNSLPRTSIEGALGSTCRATLFIVHTFSFSVGPQARRSLHSRLGCGGTLSGAGTFGLVHGDLLS
jgi:hypothetical protein